LLYGVNFTLPSGNSVAKADPVTVYPCWGTCSTTITALAAGTLTTGNVGAYGQFPPSYPYCGKQFNVTVVSPTPTPAPAYSISGYIFNDANGDYKRVKKVNGNFTVDPPYTGVITISISPSRGSYNSPVGTGRYSFTDLPAGEYIITFSGPLAAGMDFTYPFPNPVNRYFDVVIGDSCSPSGIEAECSNGYVIKLNAAITTLKPAWFQSVGSDMRWDNVLSPYSGIPPSGKFASLDGTGGMPGIIFSGITSPFGSQTVSSTNWKVSGNSSDLSNRDIFTDTHSIIPTSYRFLLETTEGSGIVPTAITSLTNITAHGIYKAEDLTINADYTFPANQSFIILINGNLTINGKIKVPVGSTAIFSAKGNITVNKTVGETVSSTASTIEGLYSADRDFIADGTNSCPTIDKRLNVAGSVIANAGRGGGTFTNNRTLCEGNSTNPSVSFTERPDFMLNYPSMVKQTTRAWQEVAP